MNIEYEWSKFKENFWLGLAFKVPRKLAYWCAIRVSAHATGPKYPTQVVPDLTFMDALDRWDK